MPPAVTVAPAIITVGKCALSAARVCRAACRNSTSSLHLRKSVAAAGNQHRQWQSDQKSPETYARPPGVPRNYLLGGMSRLVLWRLHVAQKERGHEEGGWEDEEQFRGSNSVLG